VGGRQPGPLSVSTGLPLRGLLFGFAGPVTSGAAGMVPTGVELTLFEAVGRVRA
jgi:hypothetical protein